MAESGKKLILSDYYDVVAEDLSENAIGILTKLTNADSYKDINPCLWNSGIIESTLDNISKRIQKARNKDKKNNQKIGGPFYEE